MKLPFLIGGAVGYVLGARAGRERYETIVRIGRRVVGSQTVQSTAGVLQARIDALSQQARSLVAARLGAGTGPMAGPSSNGYHR